MMRRRHILFGVAAILLTAFPVRAQDEARRAAAFVDKGNELLEKGKYQEALSAYDEAKIAKPDSPEVAYDRGLALYRLKEYEKAEKAFQGALQPERPDLESKTKFNLGRCAHEAAITHVDKLDQAVGDLERAIHFYSDALQLNEKDADAASNRAAAERLRAFLQKKLQEQQQKKQSPSSQPTSQPNEEPTSQPQQQPSSQPDSQPQDQQQQQDEQGEKGDQQKESGDQEDAKDENQKGDKKEGGRQDQSSEGEPQDQEQAQEDEQKAADEKQQQAQMSKEQTDAMLQEARDMEHQRREAKRARMMRIRGRAPVAKDW